VTEWLTIEEAVRVLGVGPATVERWADEGRLPYNRTAGGHRCFRRSSVEQLLRHHPDREARDDAVDRWVRWLRHHDVRFVIDELAKLHDELADWYAVADFLGKVTTEIGQCWEDGEFSIVDEHIASAKLDQATAAIAHGLRVDDDAAVCLLATPQGERHSLGLCLCQLCLKSTGIGTRWVGVDVPTGEIIRHLRDPQTTQDLLALSASHWMSDPLSLGNQYWQIAATCRDADITLLVGGEGAWPENVGYGFRCHSFSDLKKIRGQLV
jgi:excisionase family DNA binding protein